MWAVLLVFFLDDDVFHEISFEFFESFGIEGSLLEAVFAVIAVLALHGLAGYFDYYYMFV